MGKSDAIKTEFQVAADVANSQTEVVKFHDLRKIGSEQYLYNEVLRAPQIGHWLANDQILTLFLDSFDECILSVKKLAANRGMGGSSGHQINNQAELDALGQSIKRKCNDGDSTILTIVT